MPDRVLEARSRPHIRALQNLRIQAFFDGRRAVDVATDAISLWSKSRRSLADLVRPQAKCPVNRRVFIMSRDGARDRTSQRVVRPDVKGGVAVRDVPSEDRHGSLCARGSVSAVWPPPSFGDERLLKADPAIVGLLGRGKYLTLLGPLRFGNDDFVPRRVVSANLALEELRTALKKIEHLCRLYRVGVG
jgi:hypothetical protein